MDLPLGCQIKTRSFGMLIISPIPGAFITKVCSLLRAKATDRDFLIETLKSALVSPKLQRSDLAGISDKLLIRIGKEFLKLNDLEADNSRHTFFVKFKKAIVEATSENNLRLKLYKNYFTYLQNKDENDYRQWIIIAKSNLPIERQFKVLVHTVHEHRSAIEKMNRLSDDLMNMGSHLASKDIKSLVLGTQYLLLVAQVYHYIKTDCENLRKTYFLGIDFNKISIALNSMSTSDRAKLRKIWKAKGFNELVNMTEMALDEYLQSYNIIPLLNEDQIGIIKSILEQLRTLNLSVTHESKLLFAIFVQRFADALLKFSRHASGKEGEPTEFSMMLFGVLLDFLLALFSLKKKKD